MKNRSSHQKSQKGIKVTYISSPMKVKTSASNFRDLVQKLTGKSSNVAEANFMEEARNHENDDDYELIVKGSSSSSSSSLELEQQWRSVVDPEPDEEEEAASPAWLKLQDSTSLLVDPLLNEQLVMDFLGFDVF
ncbi:uncharacterized protein LOC114744215 [Neltuma alba]|uniref:uncharacterized protein LOC114744215 n=1 Tax=Neltuma alba TaxID=207710 RepID=UPI0010A2C303|nr:uncharacterized protein LOC114744215 [Prosopis alba]